MAAPKWFKVFEVPAGLMIAEPLISRPSAVGIPRAKVGAAPSRPPLRKCVSICDVPFADLSDFPSLQSDDESDDGSSCSHSVDSQHRYECQASSSGHACSTAPDSFSFPTLPHREPGSPHSLESAAASRRASASAAACTDPRRAGAPPGCAARLTPDLRRGRLSLWREGEDAGNVKLLWTPGDGSERHDVNLFAPVAEAPLQVMKAAEITLSVNKYSTTFRSPGSSGQVSAGVDC